jgi:hypothetical protein
MWTQNSPGIHGAVEASDWFGGSLAAGDLGKGTPADLGIGAADEQLAGAGLGAIVAFSQQT